MSCPYHTTVYSTQSDTEINATFQGVLAAEAVGLLVGLAQTVRAAGGPRKVRLDISDATAIYATGLAGLVAVEQAVNDMGGTLEIRASGPDAAPMLATVGLAGVLYSGP